MTRAWLVATLFLLLAVTVFGVSLRWQPGETTEAGATPTPSSGLFTVTPAAEQPAS